VAVVSYPPSFLGTLWILSALRGARLYYSQKSKKSFFRDSAVANRDGTTRHITKKKLLHPPCPLCCRNNREKKS
jgi:hypothetical protein